jgi:hypothetical protein
MDTMDLVLITAPFEVKESKRQQLRAAQAALGWLHAARRPGARRQAPPSPSPEAGGTQVAGRGAKAGKPAARCFWPAVVRPLWPGSRPALLLLVLLLVGIWDLGRRWLSGSGYLLHC